MSNKFSFIRNDFPIFSSQNGKNFAYLDFASTSQTPQSVLDAMNEYYTSYRANIHRGVYAISERATQAVEESHRVAAKFFGVNDEEVIFTKNATESLNFLAFSIGNRLKKGDEILLSRMEHHSNLVPWQQVCKRTGAVIRFIEIDREGNLDMGSFGTLLSSKTKIISICHMSNVLGTINPIAEISAKGHGVNAIVIADGSQSAGHMPVNVKSLRCDFYVCSSHKMYGPTGVGALIGRKELLEKMEPVETGGGMISSVTDTQSTWNDLPWKFEAGTPNIAGIIGFRASLEYLSSVGMDHISRHEKSLTLTAMRLLSSMKGLRVFGPSDGIKRGPVISFSMEGIHPHDVANMLSQRGFCVRAGHHCAMPLMAFLGQPALTRMSFGITTEGEEIDQCVAALCEIQKIFSRT